MLIPCSSLNRRDLFALAALWLGLTSCDGKLVTLGQARASAGAGGADSSGGASSKGGSEGGTGGTTAGSAFAIEPLFESPTLVAEIAATSTTYSDENPTLTADLLEIYFHSTRRKGDNSDDDVWVAKRTKASESFSTPVLVTPVSTDASEMSPAVAADGLSIWVGVDRDGGLGGRDVWRFDRSSRSADFGATPTAELKVNSSADDVPRPLGARDQVMPLASRREGAYQTYFASRNAGTLELGSPTSIAELTAGGEKLTDGFLSDDGLTFYFVKADGSDKGDIHVTVRESMSAPFGPPVSLTTINTAEHDERDPWLSPDGSILFFVSTRTDNIKRIFQAIRSKE